MSLTRRTLAQALALAGLARLPGAFAQGAWPHKPVKILVAFPAGGPTDVIARLVGQKLADRWGQPVLVENRPGAGGVVGCELAARAPADGSTLLMATAGNLTVNQHLYPHLKFDPVRDFTPIAQTAMVDFVLVARPEAPFRDVGELVAAARARPGAISSATSGSGGAPHLAAALFEDAARVNLQLVPYKGTAEAVNAVLAGQTDLDFDAASQVLPHLRAGRLRALAVLGARRSPLLPEVPTMAEAGLPGASFSNWFGLVAPVGLPNGLPAKLQADVAAVLQDAELRARYRAMGLQEPVAATQAQFAALIQQEAVRWGERIRAANIVAE